MSMGVSGVGGSFMLQAMSGASARMSPSQRMSTLFSKIDTSGTGSINQSQFTQAFNTMNPTAGFRAMGANAVFQSLNPSSSGTVSRQDFVQGMTQLMSQFRSNGIAG